MCLPEGDITPSVDHLVGSHKQCVGHGETKCLRRLEIDGQSKLVGWKIGARPLRRKSGLDREQTQPPPMQLIRVVSMIRHALRLPLGRSLIEQTEERLISELVNMTVHYCNSLATAIEKMRAVRSSATLIFPSPP
jgi:hypothetical protein